METLLGRTFKKGGGKVKVQQIPLSRDTEISKDFIDFVANRIRSTERLRTCTAVKGLNETLLSPEVSRVEIINIPITPAPTSNEPERTRNYSQRQMQPGSILEKSDTTKRRVKQKACEVLQQAFNCNKSQLSEIGQLVYTPSIGALKANKEMPITNSSHSSLISPESQLRPQSLERESNEDKYVVGMELTSKSFINSLDKSDLYNPNYNITWIRETLESL
jgi:hypothetical protein